MLEGLLELLRTNANMSTEEMGKMLGVSAEEVCAEIDRLQETGVICGFQAIINEDELDGTQVTAVIEVRVTPERDGGFNRIAERVSRFDEVKALYLMSGGYDLLVFVESNTLLSVARFVSEKLSSIHGILSTSTHFHLKTYKKNGIRMVVPSKDDRLVVSP